jgi:ubiquinone/menaquinone biosynthesis C-methylase UbiE
MRTGRPPALYDGFDYETFWDGAERRHLERLERRIASSLLPRRGTRILDAGGGYGRLSGAYVDRFDEAVLFDASWSLLEQARERWGLRVTLVAGDLHAMPFARRAFDAALMVRVTHHIPDPRSALSSVAGALAPGAPLVVSFSNKRNLKRVAAWWLRGEGTDPFADGVITYGPHSSGMHPRDAERMLSEAGFGPGVWRGAGVLDKLAGRAGPVGPLVPAGGLLSRPLGWARLAPALFAAAPRLGGRAHGGSVAPLFACPACRGSLRSVAGGQRCAACGVIFPVRNGIHDFRL